MQYANCGRRYRYRWEHKLGTEEAKGQEGLSIFEPACGTLLYFISLFLCNQYNLHRQSPVYRIVAAIMLLVLFWRDSPSILQTDFPSFFLSFILKELNMKNTHGHNSPVRGRGTDSWQSGGAATLWPETVYAPLSAAERNHWLCWGGGRGDKKKNTSIKHEHIQEIDCESARARGGSMSGGETRCCLAGGITESFSRRKKPPWCISAVQLAQRLI